MLRLLVFVVLVALVVLIVTKLVKGFSAPQPRTGARRDAGETPQDAKLVQCASCGAYVPRTDALPAPDGFRCSDPKCRAA